MKTVLPRLRAVGFGRAPRKSALAVAVATLFAGACPGLQAAPGDPVGPVYQVLPQAEPVQFSPSVARAANGNSVVVWFESDAGPIAVGPGNPSFEIVARRFDAAGAPLDGGFVVSFNVSASFNDVPDVAMDLSGDFVVTWRSADRRQVFARRYGADGTPAGPEFAVATASAGLRLLSPVVAMDAAGDFVIAYEHGNPYHAPSADVQTPREIVAQRYARNGVAQGAPIEVSTRPDIERTFAGNLFSSERKSGNGPSIDVAMDDAGDFVLAWAGSAYVAAGTGYIGGGLCYPYPMPCVVPPLPPVGAAAQASAVFARRYDHQGQAQGRAQMVASTLGTGLLGKTLGEPAVTMDASGAYVVAWVESPISSSSRRPSSVLARRFDATGRPRSPRGVLNLSGDLAPAGVLTPDGCCSSLTLASDAAGDFFAAWFTSGFQFAARRVAATGTPLGAPFLPDNPPAADGFSPAGTVRVASDRSGNFSLVWDSSILLSESPPYPRLYRVEARNYFGP